MVFSGIILVLTLFVGPVFCSWVSPLGSVQEWIGKIGKKVFKKRYNKLVPEKIHNILKYGRYIVLIWVIYVTTKSLSLVFQDYDPYYALINFYTNEVAISALIIIGIVLLASVFVERPWCKYACPYGGFLGLVSQVKITKIKRDKNLCIECQKCDNVCPMKIEISIKDKVT